jgi:hypothetical protein
VIRHTAAGRTGSNRTHPSCRRPRSESVIERPQTFDELIPRPVAGIGLPLRLDAVAARLRELDAAARRSAPRTAPVVRALLGTESLSSAQVMELAAGRPIAGGAEADRRMRRFEQACRDGHRAATIDRRLLLRVHSRLVTGGALRTGPVRVGRKDAETIFAGPPAPLVEELLDDLIAFLARDDLCPVVQAAVAYAQLEFVHPFPDGNGRMGRWLIQVVLRRRGVAGLLVPPVGVYFAANPGTFLPAHRAYRDGDAPAWCTFVGAALEACAGSVGPLFA